MIDRYSFLISSIAAEKRERKVTEMFQMAERCHQLYHHFSKSTGPYLS
jgi:hypothetical protein